MIRTFSFIGQHHQIHVNQKQTQPFCSQASMWLLFLKTSHQLSQLFTWRIHAVLSHFLAIVIILTLKLKQLQIESIWLLFMQEEIQLILHHVQCDYLKIPACNSNLLKNTLCLPIAETQVLKSTRKFKNLSYQKYLDSLFFHRKCHYYYKCHIINIMLDFKQKT